MKSVRQALILEIIEGKDVETQEELADELKRHGVNVTQATVSRDIKELRLVKVLSDKGGYKYATAERAEKGLNDRFIRIFAESVMSIVGAQNLIVIKALTGSASCMGQRRPSMDMAHAVEGDSISIAASANGAMRVSIPGSPIIPSSVSAPITASATAAAIIST